MLFAFKAAKIYKKFRSCKKVVDKGKIKDYNGIVNSKGAADDKSAALFWFYSAKSIHKGVYDVPKGFGASYAPLNFMLYLLRRNFYGISDNLTTSHG